METFGCCGDDDKAAEETGALPCIEFEGEERLLPRGVQIRDPSLQLSDLFTNWDTAKIGLDLEVDTVLVALLNNTYGGRGVLIGDPVSTNLLTVDEWRTKFNTDGVKLEGVKQFFRKTFGPGVHAQLDEKGRKVVVKLGKY